MKPRAGEDQNGRLKCPVGVLVPQRDESKISSLNQETENSFVYSLECFSSVSLLFRLAR